MRLQRSSSVGLIWNFEVEETIGGKRECPKLMVWGKILF